MNNHWFGCFFKTELLISWRQRGELINGLLFFMLVTSLFPLALGGEWALLQQMGAGVIWVAALLALLVSLERLLWQDGVDGTLEQLLLLNTPGAAYFAMLAKLLAHWLTWIIPLLLFTPILALWFGLTMEMLQTLCLALLFGSPVLCMVGAVAVALTHGLARSGVLLAILLLPWCAPVLIFGTGAVSMTAMALSAAPYLALLAAGSLITMLIAPWLIVTTLKMVVA